MLHALRATRLPLVQVVFGPGCDGESSVEAMRPAVKSIDEANALLAELERLRAENAAISATQHGAEGLDEHGENAEI